MENTEVLKQIFGLTVTIADVCRGGVTKLQFT